MDSTRHDVIVIGSGIGGLGCAAALARFGRRVVMFEKHTVAGGLTHTFQRDGYVWDVGVHYLGQTGPGQPIRRVLDWLSGGALSFASMGAVYDEVHLADGFRFQYARPRAALESNLREAFPRAESDIARWFAALDGVQRCAHAPFQRRAMPSWLDRALGWWQSAALRRWWGPTTAEVLAECTTDPRLRAVLGAQWGDHGGPPSVASFAMHALIQQHYLDGAWYPVGGAAAFAKALIPVVESAGGSVRTRAPVTRILIEHGRATGIELADGARHHAGVVISDVGARNTVARLLPRAVAESQWGRAVSALVPSLCHVGLYLGLEGDVESAGASRSNHWIYAGADIEAVWDDPFGQARAPCLFVSFPSLKDPAHRQGSGRHTAEVVAWTDWKVFAPWADTAWGARPADYVALRSSLETSLRAQFDACFPGLAPMVRTSALSTPLSTVHFTGHDRGAIYGLATTPQRFASRALDIRTPCAGCCSPGRTLSHRAWPAR